MDYEEAVAQKDKLYSRIKEVRSLLEHCRSGGERLRQTERLRKRHGTAGHRTPRVRLQKASPA